MKSFNLSMKNMIIFSVVAVITLSLITGAGFVNTIMLTTVGFLAHKFINIEKKNNNITPENLNTHWGR